MREGTLIEGTDYYFDEYGRFVLTESFLKKRGFCCKNGCRHCPYGEEKNKSTEAIRTEQK